MQSPNRSAYTRTRPIIRPKQKSKYKPPPRGTAPGPPTPRKIRRNHHLMPRIDGRGEPLLTSCDSYDRQKRKVYARRSVGLVRNVVIHSENTSGKLKASMKMRESFKSVPENPIEIKQQEQAVQPMASSKKSTGSGDTRSTNDGAESSLYNVEEWLSMHPDLKSLNLQSAAPSSPRKSVSEKEVSPPFPPSVEHMNSNNTTHQKVQIPVPEIHQVNTVPNFVHQTVKKVVQEPMNPMFRIPPRGNPAVKGWNKNFRQFIPPPPMLPGNEMFLQVPPPIRPRPCLPYPMPEYSVRHGAPQNIPHQNIPNQNIPPAKIVRAPMPPPPRSYLSRQKKQTITVNQAPAGASSHGHLQLNQSNTIVEEELPTSVFVGNLGPDVDEINLSNLFLSIGPVKSATVVREKVTMASKGFGFVTYRNSTHAQIAIEKFSGVRLGGIFENKSLKVNLARNNPTAA